MTKGRLWAAFLCLAHEGKAFVCDGVRLVDLRFSWVTHRDGSKMAKGWQGKFEQAEVVVFDMDGTLVDSDQANFLAYQEAITQVLSKKVKADLASGVRITRKVLKNIFPQITSEQLEAVTVYKDRVYHKYLSATKLNAKLMDVISRANGKDIVLATSSRRARAEMLLNYHGVMDIFTRKIFKEFEGQRNKYVRLMERIPQEGASMLVFENDEFEIASAVACGIGADRIINVCGARLQ